MTSHPLLDAVSWQAVHETETYIFDAVGGRTQQKFLAGIGWKPGDSVKSGLFGPVTQHEEIFEWLDLIRAVQGARGTFTFVELGCGYGRWMGYAHHLLRQLNPMPATWVGVDAEPTHFKWSAEHARDNGFGCKLLDVAIGAGFGTARFYFGNPDSQYGQALAPEYAPENETIDVAVIPLSELLKDIERVDLVDCDIQGAELEVMAAATEVLAGKVARVHIGTHTHEVEDGLREVFTGLGWESVHDYPCAGRTETIFGPISFTDGAQSWRNPALT